MNRQALFRRCRWWLRQRRPHGLFSLRYLWPGNDACIRRHRLLWWLSGNRWPRPLWLLLQAGLVLRWYVFSVWVDAWRAWRRYGADAVEHQGIGPSRQIIGIARLSLGWCIPSRDVYRYGLLSRPEAALDYVFGPEINAYHAWRGKALGLQSASVALLADKLALADTLRGLGIPAVEIWVVTPVTRNAPALAGLIGGHQRVFCKTRSGNRGLGAFAAWYTGSGLAGRTFDGRNLQDAVAVEAAWRQLTARGDALVQPCLGNHPRLAPLAETDDAITVRYISHWRHETLDGLCAWLEIPAGQDTATGRPVYGLLPVEMSSGRIQRLPDLPGLTRIERDRANAIYRRLSTERTVPGWSRLVEASHEAHRRFHDVWAIAWDWVPTPEGPVLLEGNTGWGVTMPQRLLGGLLAGSGKLPQSHWLSG